MKCSGRSTPETARPNCSAIAAIDQGERDRNSKPAIEHFVEITVPRVVIVFLITAKLLFDEKDPVYLSEDFTSTGAGPEPGAYTIRQVMNSYEISFNVDFGIGIAPNLEGNPGQIDVADSREQTLKLRTIRERRRHTRLLPRRVNLR